MNIEPSPFPFDANRLLRATNLRRARQVYRSALRQAEQINRNGWGPDASSPKTWAQPLDLAVIEVQPFKPSETLLSPPALKSRLQSLKRQWDNDYLYAQESPVPNGLMYSSFRLRSDWRRMQLFLDNGLVCDFGGVHRKSLEQGSRLHLPQLVVKIARTLHLAHALHMNSDFAEGMTLRISVEDLGQHSLEPLVGGGWTNDHDIALLENWTWDFFIAIEAFREPTKLNAFILRVIEEVCWGLGNADADTESLKTLSSHLRLALPENS